MRSPALATSVAIGMLLSLVANHLAAQQGRTDRSLAAAVSGEWRSPEEMARDSDRHPLQALTFWGLKPGMSILELQPGGGWWTRILAPYARLTRGEFHATAADLGNPDLSENARKNRVEFAARFADQSTYGRVQLVNWGAKAAPLPTNRYDFVLAARVFHGWWEQGSVDANLANVFRGLKPGGVLAIEQHRGNPGQQPAMKEGYVTEQAVIDAATRAGFRLDGRSEINANARDTKDHPFGVWTLPPTRRSAPDEQTPVNPGFDRARYDAIGESDRMTLRFVKPKR